MDDPANIAFVSLGAMLNRDDPIIELLASPTGSAFVRDPATGDFVACSDEN